VSVGHVGPTTEYFCEREQGIPFLRSQNVRPGHFDLESAAAITPEFHRKLKKSQLQAGDILFVRVGANRGDCCVVPKGAGELNCANIVFARPHHPTGFHAYFFQSELGRSLLLSASVGAAQGVINTSSVASMPVPSPSLPVQQRIAGILSAYDELIENSQRRIRILEAMARALYREWFVHFRFPGHENHPLVASSLGDTPKGWQVKTLGEIAEAKRRNVSKGELDQPQPYVGLEHIPRRSLALDAWEMTADLGSNKLEFKKGEVLFGKIRPYFHKASVAPFNGLCSADTIVIRARRPEHYAFVVASVSSDAFVAHASATANGAKMPRANWDVLEKYEVVIPSGKVAEKFSALFADIIAQQQALIFQIQNLRTTRDLLLPRLLSGQFNIEVY
jgi:type I restriction enzyme S subunit